jgi:hypothetical protein
MTLLACFEYPARPLMMTKAQECPTGMLLLLIPKQQYKTPTHCSALVV